MFLILEISEARVSKKMFLRTKGRRKMLFLRINLLKKVSYFFFVLFHYAETFFLDFSPHFQNSLSHIFRKNRIRWHVIFKMKPVLYKSTRTQEQFLLSFDCVFVYI